LAEDSELILKAATTGFYIVFYSVSNTSVNERFEYVLNLEDKHTTFCEGMQIFFKKNKNQVKKIICGWVQDWGSIRL
jgi:hypothetical protein